MPCTKRSAMDFVKPSQKNAIYPAKTQPAKPTAYTEKQVDQTAKISRRAAGQTEKTPQKTIDSAAKTVQKIAHKVELDHVHAMSVTGVEDVPTFTDKNVVIRLKGETLTVSGQNLAVKSLDIGEGKLQIEGQVNALKYSSSTAPTSFAKRIFR